LFVVCLPPSRSSLFSPAPPTPRFSTLSLHDALPISALRAGDDPARQGAALPHHGPARPTRRPVDFALGVPELALQARDPEVRGRSEEHTSELQSRENLVCRLLLEKKKECM